MKKFEDVITKEQYEELKELGLLEDLDYIYMPGLINLDIDDYEMVFKDGKLCGYVKTMISDPSKLEIIKIKDAEHVDCIIHILGDDNLTLKCVDIIISKCRDAYKDVNVLYGSAIDPNLNGFIKVNSFFISK